MKIRKLHIDEYKMFKNFDIDFVDENDEALPIVVLAGVNGTGKTTLLESLSPYPHPPIVNQNHVVYKDRGWVINLKTLPFKQGDNPPLKNRIDFLKELKEEIIYFSASVNELENIEIKIVEEYIKTAEEIDSFKKALHGLQEKINDIFEGLDIGFRFSRVDYNNKKVFLTAKENAKEFEINRLSTGEKTLMSKVLLLYFGGYEDKIILIDEPELSLHPSWQNKVLKIYENFALQNNCQIIIATHSPHIIGSAKNEYLRILRKNDESRIEVVSGLKAEGRDINSILFDVMGEVAYRPQKFRDMIDKLFIQIDNKNIDEAKKQLEVLKKSYGEEDSTILEAQMLIEIYSEA